MRIEWVGIRGETSGSVEYVDDRLVTTDANIQAVIDDWLERGGTEEEFVVKFSNWTNGYVTSRIVEDS